MPRFAVYGPLSIDLDDDGNIPRSMRGFWASADELRSGLRGAKGCYVFGIRSSGGSRITPWYIGKTNNQTFEGECFKPHQRVHYGYALNKYVRKRPVMYLIPQLATGGKLYRGRAGRAIEFVEKYLIGFGLFANEDILNKKDTKLYNEVVVPGLLNSGKGKRSFATKSLCHTLYAPSQD